jgi:hypothetical protein
MESSMEGQKGFECERKMEESPTAYTDSLKTSCHCLLRRVLVMGSQKAKDRLFTHMGSSDVKKRGKRTLCGPHSSLLPLVVKVETARPNMQVANGSMIVIHGQMLVRHLSISDLDTRLSPPVSR